MHFGLIWVFLEKIGASLLSVMVFFVYAKFLTTAEMGTAVMILSITQFLAGLISTFFEDVLVQKKELDPRDVDTTFWGSTIVSLIVMILASLGFWAWSYHAPEYNILPLALFATLEILVTNVITTYVAQLRRTGQFKILAFRVILGRIAGSLMGLACIFAHLGPWSIIVQSVMGMVMQYVILLYTVRSIPGFNISFGLFRTNLKFGTLTGSQRLVWDAFVRMTPLAAGIVGGPSLAGVMGFAWRIVELPRSAISSGLSSYLLPLLSRFQHDPTEMANQFVKLTRIITFFVTPMFLGLCIVAPHMILGLFGEKWADTIPLIQLFSISALIGCYRIPATISMTAIGRPGRMVVVEAIANTTTIASIFLFGMQGAWMIGAAYVGRNILTMPRSITIVRDALALTARQQLTPIAQYMLPGLLMLIGVQIAGLVLPHATGHFNMMMIEIGTGVTIFTLASLALYRADLRDWKRGLVHR